MKRLLALLLAFAVVTVVTPSRFVVAQEKDKKEDKKAKDDKDKADKDKADKDKADKDKDKKDDKPPSEAQKKELEKLTGTFNVILFERDGEKTPPDELKKWKVTQKGGEWTFTVDGDSTKGKDTVYPDKNPKEIDSLYLTGSSKDKMVKGIYKIEDDTITYCFADVPGKERPTKFETKADSGYTMMVLKRVKEEKKDDKDKKVEKDKDKKEEKKDKDKKEDKEKDKKEDKDKDKKKDDKEKKDK